MSVDKYLFWSNIQYIVNNLNDLDIYREVKWVKNFSFKENLDIDIKIIDNLLEKGEKGCLSGSKAKFNEVKKLIGDK